MKALIHSLKSVRRKLNVLRGRDLRQPIQLQCEVMCLGDEGAKWSICPVTLSPRSVVYSFGVGEDISFDLQLIRQFGMQVHAFDPTPRSIEWIRKQTLPEELRFHSFGILDIDGRCQLRPPKNPRFVSHTILQTETPWPAIEAPVHRLKTIMNMLGHNTIDLLKMDIEGAEYRVIGDLLESDVTVRQLLVEFHHRWPEVGAEKTKNAIHDLNRAGYRIFNASHTGEEYSFLKTPVE
jgi:FkbM family methyltransferase